MSLQLKASVVLYVTHSVCLLFPVLAYNLSISYHGRFNEKPWILSLSYLSIFLVHFPIPPLLWLLGSISMKNITMAGVISSEIITFCRIFEKFPILIFVILLDYQLWSLLFQPQGWTSDSVCPIRVPHPPYTLYSDWSVVGHCTNFLGLP